MQSSGRGTDQQTDPEPTRQRGDFTGLALDYSRHRPDYSTSVLRSLVGLIGKPVGEIDFVDVGAGTGIWTRMVAAAGVRSATAVEPNDDMRTRGVADSTSTAIRWVTGKAETTGLADCSADWLSMASSFHWTKFDETVREFHRVLRPNGWFTALWNPRLIELNPVLVDIESQLTFLQPDISRVSSGRSGITESLTQQLWDCKLFDDVVYIDGRHSISMTPDRYIGAWRSVNDLRVQLGSEKFNLFLKFVADRICAFDVIETTYWTRAWSARRRG